MAVSVERATAAIERLRGGGSDRLTRRRTICLACPQHFMRGDLLRCQSCRCADPARDRPRCPAGRWGITPTSGCVHLTKLEATAICALGLEDCAGCPKLVRSGTVPTPAVTTPTASPGAAPDVSIVAASRNEGAALTSFVAMMEAIPCVKQVIVIDDASDPPEDAGKTRKGILIRNGERLGCSQSRAIGCALATHLPVVCDPHIEVAAQAVETVARAAEETGGLAYANCKGYGGAALLLEKGLLRCKWLGRAEAAHRAGKRVRLATAGFMGAFYGIARPALDRIGGWIRLPGSRGQNEEAMSVLLLRYGVPITVCLDALVVHDFDHPDRAGSSWDDYWLNVLAQYRLLFGDQLWADYWKPRLRSFEWRHQGKWIRVEPGEHLFAVVEGEPWASYGESLRARMTVPELDFLAMGWGVR